MDATTTKAAKVAADMAWLGGIVREDRFISEHGSDVRDRALALGLIESVPRIGGYVASRKALAREFGRDYVRAIDKLAGL